MDQAEDQETSLPTEETLASDENVMVEGDESADTTSENVSEEGYVDDVLGNLSELDLKSRTKERIETLATEKAEALSREQQLTERLAHMEGQLETLGKNTSNNGQKALEDFSLEELKAAKSNREEWELNDATVQRIDELIVDRRIDQAVDQRLGTQKQENSLSTQQDIVNGIARNYGGEEIFDEKSKIRKSTDKWFTELNNSELSDPVVLRQLAAFGLAYMDLNKGRTRNLETRNKQLAKSQMVEKSGRALSPGPVDFNGALKEHVAKDGALSLNTQGQRNGSARDVIMKMGIIQSLNEGG